MPERLVNQETLQWVLYYCRVPCDAERHSAVENVAETPVTRNHPWSGFVPYHWMLSLVHALRLGGSSLHGMGLQHLGYTTASSQGQASEDNPRAINFKLA